MNRSRSAVRARATLLLGSVATLAACSTPYGTLVVPDYGAPQTAATILVSDPKLYRREALIEERREEIAYLNALMKASEAIVFTPEIVREIEVIRALSMSLGIGSNPAAGSANRQTEAIADLRNELALTELELELAQLRRDAELVRAGFVTQEAPVNTGLGTLSDGTLPAIQSITAADAATVITRIDSLQSTLAARLAVSVPGPRVAAITANPIDLFRDRAAYRALLTTARNAASLDELHDSGGNALARLTFQATVLPNRDGKHDRAVGLVDMALAAQSPDIKSIYQAWIGYLNSPEAGANSDVLRLSQRGDLFSTLYLQRKRPAAQPLAGADPPTKPGAKPAPAVAVARSPQCNALVSLPSSADCDHLRVILPKMIDPTTKRPLDLSAWVDALGNGSVEDLLDQGTSAALQLALADRLVELIAAPRCEMRVDADFLNKVRSVRDPLVSQSAFALEAAQFLPALIPSLVEALQQANAAPDELAAWNMLHGKALGLIGLVGARACNGGSLTVPDLSEVPNNFTQAINTASTQIRVYDVGPREQVQQISTTARAADAISLAAAISAQDATGGKGLSAAAGFSRQATGKAEQIERNPLIVGYAHASTAVAGKHDAAHFGWVLGPRAGIDTEQEQVALRQTARVHDLSVDISYPGWMRSFDLTVRTALAPAWRGLSLHCTAKASRIVQSLKAEVPKADTAVVDEKSVDQVCGKGDTDPSDQLITVRTQPTAADQASLTSLLAGTSLVRRPTLHAIMPAKIKGCQATVLRVEGNHLWRAAAVQLGPHRLEGSAIRVLPDLAGVMVEVPKGLALAADARLAVLTPYGAVSSGGGVQLTVEAADKCDDPANANKPAITSIDPPRAGVCGAQEFTLKGRQLKEADGVRINGALGSVKDPKDDGTMVKAVFTKDQIQAAFNQQSNGQLHLLKKSEILASAVIEMPTTLPCPPKEQP